MKDGRKPRVYVIRDKHGKFILEVRLGNQRRRKTFDTEESATLAGEKILASGAVSEWISAKKPAPRMRTEWAKKHKRVMVRDGWRGRPMLGGYSR